MESRVLQVAVLKHYKTQHCADRWPRQTRTLLHPLCEGHKVPAATPSPSSRGPAFDVLMGTRALFGREHSKRP